MSQHGIFTVSLDFELYWGVRDSRALVDYQSNLDGVRGAVYAMLQLFSEYQIRATWAAVGFLYFKNREELVSNIPKKIPHYKDEDLSPYDYIISQVELQNKYHFAPDLINQIENCDGQEIATHTFSHYYCLEDGQTYDSFIEDIKSALNVAECSGAKIKSIVFPRNQVRLDYLPELMRLGIVCYRGNEDGWLYRATGQDSNGYFRRLVRFLDSYFNVSGHNLYDLGCGVDGLPLNIPSSRFLRPYSHHLRWFEGYKIKRIKRSMLEAAVNKKVFHLWWHPHNFGVRTEENIGQLEELLQYYRMLHEKYGMQSLNMADHAGDLI